MSRIPLVDFTLRPFRLFAKRFLPEALRVILRDDVAATPRRRRRGINSDSIGKRVARSSLVEKFNRGLLLAKVMSH